MTSIVATFELFDSINFLGRCTRRLLTRHRGICTSSFCGVLVCCLSHGTAAFASQ